MRNLSPKILEDWWILLSAISWLFCIHSSSAELKLVQAVFRHGNKAPSVSLNIYPNDPYINNTLLPEGKGGLTNKGKMTSFNLGKFYKERYGSFLGPIYTRDIIHFRADEIERVVMTAQLVAAALFPPTSSQRWNADLNWQPVPVWMVPFESDTLYNGLFCTNYKKWRTEVETSERVRNHQNTHKNLLNYLSKNTGTDITSFKTFFLRQILHAELDVGLKLPEWTKTVFPNKTLDTLSVFAVRMTADTNKMKQVLGGQWLGEWLNNVDKYFDNARGTSKAYMYGAHDLNIIDILMALNSFDDHIPSYCSTVVFELHEIEKKYFVQVIHKDQEKLRVLEIPGCRQKMCPLNVFREIVKPLIPKDPKKLCGDIVRKLF